MLVWRDALWTGDVEYVKTSCGRQLRYSSRTSRRRTRTATGFPTTPASTRAMTSSRSSARARTWGFSTSARCAERPTSRGCSGWTPARLSSTPRRRRRSMTLDKQLWNGEYYDLSFDAAKAPATPAAWPTRCAADWFCAAERRRGARRLTRRRRRHSRRSAKYCTRPEGFLANCDWPRGGEVKIRRLTSDQAQLPLDGRRVRGRRRRCSLWASSARGSTITRRRVGPVRGGRDAVQPPRMRRPLLPRDELVGGVPVAYSGSRGTRRGGG